MPDKSLLVVFLSLAALYESWSIPLAVLLVIPLGLVGAVIAVWARGLENNIFFQVGLLTTMGLAAKNAILIVDLYGTQLCRNDRFRTITPNAIIASGTCRLGDFVPYNLVKTPAPANN